MEKLIIVFDICDAIFEKASIGIDFYSIFRFDTINYWVYYGTCNIEFFPLRRRDCSWLYYLLWWEILLRFCFIRLYSNTLLKTKSAFNLYWQCHIRMVAALLKWSVCLFSSADSGSVRLINICCLRFYIKWCCYLDEIYVQFAKLRLILMWRSNLTNTPPFWPIRKRYSTKPPR